MPTWLPAAAVLASLVVSSALAQPADRTLADARPDPGELTRKVEAGESEAGFCATVNWPRRTTIAPFFAFLDSSQAGSTYLARSLYDTGGGCSYYRVLSVSQKGQQKCADTISWACFDTGDYSGKCIKGTRTWCREGNGAWKRQI